MDNVKKSEEVVAANEEELTPEELGKVSGGFKKPIVGDPCEGGEVFHP